MRDFLNELRRRNVLRVAVGYFAMAWLLIQVLETVFPFFAMPAAYVRWVIIALVILFLPVMALSWAFEWSLSGVESQEDIDRGAVGPRRDTRGFDRVVITLLSLALVYFAVDKFLLPSIDVGVREPPSIAVMPFVDMTAAQDQAFFGDGLAEDLMNMLARNPALRVVARTSSFRFRDTDLPIEDIAQQLGVSHILEGSIRNVGSRARISVQLISGRDGYNVWSDAFDRNIQEIFAVRNAIQASVESALEVSDTAKSSSDAPPDAEAYVIALRAGYLARDSTKESRTQAVELYMQALEIDPSYALAWSNLATTYSNQALAGDIAWEDGYRKSRSAALQSIAVDQRHAPGYKALAFVEQNFEGDMPAAIANMQRALSEAPARIAILSDAAIMLLNIGQIEDSIRIQEYVVERSPVSVIATWNLALRYRYVDRLAESEHVYRRVRELSPDKSDIDYNLGETLFLMGRYGEALELFTAEKDEAYRLKGMALAYFAIGERDLADEALTELIERFGDQWPSEVVHVYASRGELEEAFTWLEKEYETYGPGGWGEWQLQRLYDNLREDPRWQVFLKKTGTAPEQLSVLSLNIPVRIYE